MKVPRSILDYISKLTPVEQDGLYTDRFAVLTVFQSLSPLAKQYVLRLMLLGAAPISRKTLDSWFNKDHVAPPVSAQGAPFLSSTAGGGGGGGAGSGKEHRQARDNLISLRVLVKSGGDSSSASSTPSAFSPVFPSQSPTPASSSSSSSSSSLASSSSIALGSSTASGEEYRLHTSFSRFLLDEVCGGVSTTSGSGPGGDEEQDPEGKEEARKKSIPVAVIEQAVEVQFRSRASCWFFSIAVS
jgi:hypothetical protein